MLLRHLAEGMREALAAGDVEAARIAHETIGRLLGAPAADAGGVVDLAAERSRRGASPKTPSRRPLMPREMQRGCSPASLAR
ncbi:hypothetical protein [Sorangium sp. So ce1151]|uniref:hypothetical protein n=1 Tax=Sorangium sp. So ce1151 TaxID=3133332 RepID=UPI003F60D899